MAETPEYANVVPKELQDKVRMFFEVYDPERLQSSDFNVLLRYISNRGIEALEEKLKKKYGVNIASMEKKDSSEGRQLPEEDKELSELDNLPPPPEPMPASRKSNKAFQSLKMAAGVDPAGMAPEDEARAKMFQRLTDFYKEFNQEKLRSGIGEVVDYALSKGEGKINAKLMKTYGEDLNSFEKRREKKWRQSAQIDMQNMLAEEKKVGEMEPGRQKLRQDLIDFFLIVEPPRAELRMDPLLDYAEKHGVSKLNQKLFDKYGYNLEERPPAVANFSAARTSVPTQVQKQERFDDDLNSIRGRDLPEYVRLMLGRYYAKYDQVMLEDGGVDAVYEWTRRNGLEKLNRKLKARYGESLQDFIQMANEVRDDLIEFYRHRDRNKLVIGIQAILDWGLRNGRAALNEKLKSKYGVDLDVANEVYDEVMESASQF